MLPPLPRRSDWAYGFAHSPSRISLPRKGDRVGLRIVLFEACSAFTRVTACTLAKSPFVTRCIEGFSHFVTSMTSPITSGGSNRRVGLSPTGKRRLITAHTLHCRSPPAASAKAVKTLGELGNGQFLRTTIQLAYLTARAAVSITWATARGWEMW